MSSTKNVSRRPMTIKIAGRILETWTSCEVGRDLADIAGSFRIRYLDEVRSAALLGGMSPEFAAIHDRDPVEISINGTVILKGWVDDINLMADEHTAEAIISGRDVTGDLVDCSANPIGPGEYRQINLETLVGHLTNPYQITLDRQIETGAPFTLVALEPGDTVMDAIEHHARQRGVLVTSNGVGGIVLTQAGTTRASDSLSFPGNVRGIEVRISSRNRHSDVWVKGQFKSLQRPSKAVLDASAAPLSSAPTQPPAAPSHRKVELASSTRYGHWVDPEVTRFRPRVWMAKTQSGGSVAAQQSTNPPLDSTAQGLSDDAGPSLA
ncbi:phage baseplate assembly protein [Asaia sp. HN010]|uniref:phage baseplate assembly protein n=1 Tax=Asaia sp. HN010 TaxID=3081233 RepID=UPI00301879C9